MKPTSKSAPPINVCDGEITIHTQAPVYCENLTVTPDGLAFKPGEVLFIAVRRYTWLWRMKDRLRRKVAEARAGFGGKK